MEGTSVADSKGEWQIPAWVTEPSLANMNAALKASATVTDLFKLAASEDFKLSVSALKPDEQKVLRATYKEVQTALDGKVRLDTYDGQVVLIVGADWWHSDQYDADGVTLHIRAEREPDKLVKVLTSSAPVVRFAKRFANQLREVPSEAHPVRAFVQLVPVRDPARAKLGHKIWSIKSLPPARQASEGGVPF